MAQLWLRAIVFPVKYRVCFDAEPASELTLKDLELKPSLFDMIAPSLRVLRDFRRSGGFEADATERQ